MSTTKKTKKEDLKKLQEENERLKKSIEDLWTINQLARIISSTMPVNQILDKVISVSVKAIGAEQGTISLLEKKRSEAPFKTLVRKVDSSKIDTKYRLDEDLSGWMLKNRKPLVINDISTDDTFQVQHALAKGIHSILSVPLMCKGKLIGVVNLFNKKEGGKFLKGDQRLLSIIASQSAQVIENARLYEEEKQLRNFEQELKMALDIQIGLLPKESPQIGCIDLAGKSIPAKVVGGDYFDFIELGSNRWGIALGDVSGKGIPAAFLMSNLQATLRGQALINPSIKDCIAKANYLLYSNTEPDKFVTLFYGVLNCKNKTLSYVNAGHNYPYLLDNQGKFSPLEIGGLVMGMFPEYPFEEGHIQLNSGEIIVIYSDGVTEAENEQEELFGEKRLEQIVRQYNHLSANEIIEKICESVKEFTGAALQDDDITLVVLKVL
ncbi:MAG: GAF domain-containing SpoIIE family protein phosphatase [bacterium]